MLIISAKLVAGADHAKFAPGTVVPAVLLAAAKSLEGAESLAESRLSAYGWATMETVRYKTVTDFAQFEDGDPLIREAFQEALDSGFGYALFPEPAPHHPTAL